MSKKLAGAVSRFHARAARYMVFLVPRGFRARPWEEGIASAISIEAGSPKSKGEKERTGHSFPRGFFNRLAYPHFLKNRNEDPGGAVIGRVRADEVRLGERLVRSQAEPALEATGGRYRRASLATLPGHPK